MNCSHCHEEIEYGTDALAAEPGVIGPRGFIPLDDKLFFCSEDCLRDFFDKVDHDKASGIAAFCWKAIRKNWNANEAREPSRYLRAVHSLRFLRDAFRSRRDCLIRFRDDLASLITESVARESQTANLLRTKIALEATGLLDDRRVELAIEGALRSSNPWICETALRACRHLPRLSRALERELCRYLDGIPVLEFLSQQESLRFNLGLSDGFSNVRRYCAARALDLIVLTLAGVFLLVTWPEVTTLTIIFSIGWGLILPLSALPARLRRMMRGHVILTAARSQAGILLLVMSGVSMFRPMPMTSYGGLIAHTPYGELANSLLFLATLIATILCFPV